MTREEAQEILQPIHAMEQRSGQMVGRKQLHVLIPSIESYEDKRFLIRAWQDGYFERLSNVWKWQSRESILKSVTGK